MSYEPVSDASALSAPMCLEEEPYGSQGGVGGKAYAARARKFCHRIPSEKAEYSGKGFPSQPEEDGAH